MGGGDGQSGCLVIFTKGFGDICVCVCVCFMNPTGRCLAWRPALGFEGDEPPRYQERGKRNSY